MTRGARFALAMSRRGRWRTFRLQNGWSIRGRFRVTEWREPGLDDGVTFDMGAALDLKMLDEYEEAERAADSRWR